MCGFFAYKGKKNLNNLPEALERRVKFRGPDYQSGVIDFAGWKLYHCRLTILSDSTSANQPFFNDDGSVLLFNGEILNFNELAKKYDIGKNFKSDTIVLSKLLALKDFSISELDGFFAFLRIDSAGELTHAARDSFGVKPLNIYRNSDEICLSSEASIISDLFDLPLNEEALIEYEVFRAPLFSESYFYDVFAVTPGSCYITGKFFDARKLLNSTEKYVHNSEVLRTQIKSSVESRLISDFPVALLYSGGIDSNLIRANMPCDTQLICGGLVGGSYDVKFAKEQKDLGANVHIIEIDHAKFVERWEEMVKLRKEPLSVPNEVIISFLGEYWAETGGKVLLSGEGADEFFGGYDRLFRWANDPTSFSTEEFLKQYAYQDFNKISECVVRKVENYFSELSSFTKFQKVQIFFIEKHLPLLFRRLDFALMFSGIEGREPLASLGMFRLAASYYPSELVDQNIGKLPLRKVLSEDLGDEFAYRSKVGFPIDIKLVITGDVAQSQLENYTYWIKHNKEKLI